MNFKAPAAIVSPGREMEKEVVRLRLDWDLILKS
jgi:hypothetical protein